MILAIDGYEANADSRVGIGRYAFELLSRLNTMSSSFTSIRVYLPDPPKSHMPNETSIWKYRLVKPKPLWTFFAFPMALRFDRPTADVVFSPTHYIPRYTKIPKVMAIMDVSYLNYPELFRKQDLHKLLYWTAYSVNHAAKIITISKCSKNAIIKEYHVPDDRIVVAYPGRTIMKQTKQKVRKNPYIVSVGTLQPRKNFVRLIEAFSMLSDKEIELVIVGKKGWMVEDILSAPRRYGVEKRVKFLDFVADDQLPSLYQNAEVFALPSLYEGFGLPVLEAMSYGVPVVVSNTSSLPEIAGESGIYVDPTETNSIAKGLSQALTENNTTRIALGKKLAKSFTWEKAAKQVLSVLEHL